MSRMQAVRLKDKLTEQIDGKNVSDDYNERTNNKKNKNASLIDYVYDRDGSVQALSSGTAVENVYVNYVNKVKPLFGSKIKPFEVDRESPNLSI